MISFLSPEEIEALTGYKKPSAQRRWLADQEIPFIEGGDGQIKVLEVVVLQRLGGTQQNKKGPQLRLTG
ncbi:DUF4224 domain-containing protein [Pseudomonas sp. NPDC078700]|uniref:DUF4224 domain-containing protein n=1 Tax=Pseudomonas sp. NPDC078700 TaxID=3364424 RepID=UPI0037C93154